MPENSSLIVIRVGGSLLHLPQLHFQLQCLCDSLQPAPLLLITGGGHAADVIRELDVRYGLPNAKAHWDAIAAMSFNAELLVRTGNNLQLVADQRTAQRVRQSGHIPVLDTFTHLRTIGAATAQRLPESWDVTSDSIAATILRDWQGSKLILVKSCAPAASNIPRLAAVGAVDPYFPVASEGLDVEWCWLGITGGFSMQRSSQGVSSPHPALFGFSPVIRD